MHHSSSFSVVNIHTRSHFTHSFHIDKGGTIDKDEMYDALRAAGVNISEEGVLTLCNMIDEDGK